MSLQIQGIRDAVSSATAGMAAEDLLLRPAEGAKWSVAEILEHLMLSYTGTIKGMERSLVLSQPSVTRQSLRQRILTYLICCMGYFPEGRQAPKQVVPRGTPAGEVLPMLYGSLDQLDAAIDAAEKKFGKRKVMDHPLLGAFTPAEWRGFHAAHARHHMKQIAAIRSHATPQGPAASR